MSTATKFLCDHTPSKSRLFVVVRQGGRSHIEAVLTCSDSVQSERIATVLNAAVEDPADESLLARLSTVLESQPSAVAASANEAMNRVRSREWPDNPHAPSFPTAREGWEQAFAPASTAGESQSNEDDEGEEDFFTVRSAVLLHAALTFLSDQSYDEVELIDGGTTRNEAFLDHVIPPVLQAQPTEILRRFARAYDDLASDLEQGRWPEPGCMAEEMALDLALDEVERMLDDEPETVEELLRDYPAHELDTELIEAGRDLLFQDRDFEAYLDSSKPVTAEEARELWEPFLNVRDRDAIRGFRR